MVNPMEGFVNLGNLSNMKGFEPDNFGNKLGMADLGNISKLDEFIDASDNPEVLKGFVTKIQQGEGLENMDLSGLSNKDLEFVSDLQSLKGTSGPQQLTEKFSELMGQYMDSVDHKAKTAESAVETFASGGNIDVHSVMIAAEQANLSMQLTMQLRNKIVQAYQQIQQIRV